MNHRHIHTSSRLYKKFSEDIHSLLPACVPHNFLPENWNMENSQLSRFYFLPLLPELFSRHFSFPTHKQKPVQKAT